jgi:hypothetical protein
MTKAKLESLTKYLVDLKNKLTSPIPAKHVNSPETYKAFLKHEIEMVEAKLEAAKLEGVK